MTPVAAPTRTTAGLLCRRHHRLKTFTTWSWRRGADGAIEWIDPNGVRWDREPIRYLTPEVPGSDVSESDVCVPDVPTPEVPAPDVPTASAADAAHPPPRRAGPVPGAAAGGRRDCGTAL